jgi:hypothetical protein
MRFREPPPSKVLQNKEFSFTVSVKNLKNVFTAFNNPLAYAGHQVGNDADSGAYCAPAASTTRNPWGAPVPMPMDDGEEEGGSSFSNFEIPIDVVVEEEGGGILHPRDYRIRYLLPFFYFFFFFHDLSNPLLRPLALSVLQVFGSRQARRALRLLRQAEKEFALRTHALHHQDQEEAADEARAQSRVPRNGASPQQQQGRTAEARQRPRRERGPAGVASDRGHLQGKKDQAQAR